MDYERVELETYNALNEKPYEVILGGKKFMFYPLALEDREEMSLYASFLPKVNEEHEDLLAEAISCGKYAKEIASFIAAAARQRSTLPTLNLREWHRNKKKERVFNYAKKEASSGELYTTIKKICERIHPAFFLDIFISLKGTNTLKPTKIKETDQTVPGP